MDEEHKIQSGIIAALSVCTGARWLHAIPNGGKRSKITGARLKKEGVKAGVADLYLPRCSTIGGERYAGLYVEVKTAAGKQSKAQKEFETYATSSGYMYQIIRTTQDGVDCILSYIAGERWCPKNIK